MPAPPRVLFVASPDAAIEALDAVRQGGPVEGRLAPTSDILRATLAKGTDVWDAVVFVPGGPVDDVEVAAYVPESLPLVVVADEVPLLMAETRAQALPLGELAYLATGLAARDLEDDTIDADPPGHDQLASLADHLPIGLYRTGADGRFLYANPALATIVGFATPDALIEASGDDDLGYPREAFLDEIEKGNAVHNLVLSWTRRTGERVHTRESARAVRDETGAVLFYEGTMEDVTAETEALRDLRDAEASLSVVAENAPHVLYRLRYTPSGPTFDFLSPAIETLTGYRRSEIEARGGLSALLDRRNVLEGEGLLEGPVEGADRFLATYRMRTAHGERWVENTGRPWRSEDGRVLGLVGVLQDITSRKLREDDLTDAAQAALIRQRALVDLAQLEGEETYGAPAAAIAAATLGADAVSIWRSSKKGTVKALHAPAALDGNAAGNALGAVLTTVSSQRALVVGDVETDGRVDELGLRPFVDAFGLGSALLAPVRRGHRVGGIVVVHRSSPYEWTAAEAEFAAAVADAVALGIERAERTRVLAALHESERRHRVLSEMASDYAFATRERDGTTERVEWTAGACVRLTGREITGADGVRTLRRVVPRSSANVVRSLATRWRDAGQADAQFEIVTPSGERRWVHHRARRGEATPDGTVVVYHSGRDITIQRRHEDALVEARESAEAGQAAAERMNRLKSGFLANMSHEIRTPLTGILGFADLLKSELEGDHLEFVGHIERNGKRLLRTLSDVLDLSRLDAGDFGADLQLSALAPIIREVAAEHEGAADALGLRFDLELDESVGACVDPGVLRQAIHHVTDNAVKFTDAGGVMISLEAAPGPDRDEAVIRIADTGSGISDAFLEDLFDSFRQQDTGHARSHEGSGLGLALTKRFVDLLEGRIEVRSEQPGGTVVTLAFPLAELPETADAPPAFHPVPALEAAAPPADQPRDLESAPHDLEADSTPVLEDGSHALGDDPTLPIEAAEPRALEADAPVLDAHPEPAVAGDSTADAVGDPFDFAFLDAPSFDAPPTALASPTDDMFSFRRARPTPEASEASAPPEATPPFESPPAPAPPSPAAPPQAAPPAAPRPAAPRPAAPAAQHEAPAVAPPPVAPQPEPEEPVFLVRAKPPSTPPTPAPTIPEVKAPEDAEVVGEDSGDARPAVLVVEDNDDTRMLLERILRSTYDVTAVADARSALQAMNQKRFGGLVLDINLGGKETGADVLRIARSLPDYSSVFAIALTAYALPGDRERLLEAGFNEYVSKPFTRQGLMETLAAGVAA